MSQILIALLNVHHIKKTFHTKNKHFISCLFFGTFSRRPIKVLLHQWLVIWLFEVICGVNGNQKFFVVFTKLSDRILFSAGVTAIKSR
jgi:hypothetical protein